MWAGRTVAGVLLTALFLLVLALPVTATTTLEVSPAGGSAGTSVRISGAGFQPSLEVMLCWDGPGCSDLGSVAAGEDGTFSVGTAIPSGTNAGPHEIWACQEDEATGTDCALTAVVTATVDAVTTTTTPAPTSTTTLPPTTTQPTTTTAPTTTTTSTVAPPTTTTPPTTPTTSSTASSTTTVPPNGSTTVTAGTSVTATSSTTLPIPDLAGAGGIDVFASEPPEPQAAATSNPAVAALTSVPGVVPAGITTLGAVLLVLLAGAVAAGVFFLTRLLR